MRAFATLLFLIFSATAVAQLRTVPPEAKRGSLSHLQDMIVELDGKPAHLSAGAQIRDPSNRLVLPVALPPKSDVKYLVDEAGRLHRVWILSAQESAQADKEAPKPPAKKPPEKKKDKGADKR
jgi:hypothetical protein